MIPSRAVGSSLWLNLARRSNLYVEVKLVIQSIVKSKRVKEVGGSSPPWEAIPEKKFKKKLDIKDFLPIFIIIQKSRLESDFLYMFNRDLRTHKF